MSNLLCGGKNGTVCHIAKIIFLIVLLTVTVSACREASLEPAPTVTPIPTATLTPRPETTSTPLPVATAVSLPTPTLLGNYALLSPEDMRYDLDELFHRLETTHPDPYARRSKTEVDLERQRLNEELTQPLTMPDFFKKVAPLVYSLGDYHTQVYLPGDVLMAIGESERFFPLDVQMDGEQFYITANYSGNADIAPGTELLAINNIPLTMIWDEVRGYSPMGRYLSQLQLWLLFGSPQEYQVTLLAPGAATPVTQTVPSLTGPDMMQRMAAVHRPVEPVVYMTLPGEPIGILTINTFAAGLGLLLKSAFTQIQTDDVQHLILDVRANGGGYYEQVESIMDYLTDQPYRTCSQRYQAPFRGYGSGKPRELECELIQPFDVPQRYQGNLYLLIGPDTFSAGITLATILQDYEWALLIGEETADSASYCADIPSEMLPHTGLLYYCSQTCYVRPNGVLDDQSVVPGIIVQTTIADHTAGNDPVLAYTLEMIRSSMP